MPEDQLRPLLEGIRIVDLTRFIAGPYATMMLADLGAEIWKVEAPGGDPTRGMPEQRNGEGLYFAAVNRSKRSIVLDLREEADRDILRDMVHVADVLVENFRSGIMEEFGLRPRLLRGINPRLITCAITGFGTSSPYEARPAYDLVVQALAGTMSLIGESGGPPYRPGVPIGDIQAGLTADVAILAALLARERDGRGRHFEVSLLDTQLSSLVGLAANALATGHSPAPVGRGNPVTAPYGVFRARDRYLVLGVVGERFWRRFCEPLGSPAWTKDPRFATNEARVSHQDECTRLIEAELAREPADVWCDRFVAAGVPAAPVRQVDEALNDAHAAVRAMVLTLDQPKAGPVRVVGNPIKGEVGGVKVRPAPQLDQDRTEILAAVGAATRQRG